MSLNKQITAIGSELSIAVTKLRGEPSGKNRDPAGAMEGLEATVRGVRDLQRHIHEASGVPLPPRAVADHPDARTVAEASAPMLMGMCQDDAAFTEILATLIAEARASGAADAAAGGVQGGQGGEE